MYLVLGDQNDHCCLDLLQLLRDCGADAIAVGSPLVQPAEFEWRLENNSSASQLKIQGMALAEDDIKGVFVRSNGWIDPAGWESNDLMYVQAEILAALLAWLWSLPATVVNRYPPAIWYSPQRSLLSWYPALRRCGLPYSETLITNVAPEAQAFRRRLSARGVEGAVYSPLTSDARYLVTSEQEWDGLTRLADTTPLTLAVPHEAPQTVCVVGKHVFWDHQPARSLQALQPSLQLFARTLGLSFVELVVSPTITGPSIIAIEPFPTLNAFDQTTRHQIMQRIADLLMAGTEGAASFSGIAKGSST